MSDARIQELLRELRDRWGLHLVERPSPAALTAMRVLARVHSLDDLPVRQVHDALNPGRTGQPLDNKPIWRGDLRGWLLKLGLEDDWSLNSYRLYSDAGPVRPPPPIVPPDPRPRPRLRDTSDPYPKREPGPGEELCPYDGITYREVPGYLEGYGCPVCKSISAYHQPVPRRLADQIEQVGS